MRLSRRRFFKLASASAIAVTAVSTELPVQADAAETSDPSTHPSMLYDTTKCVGCRACQNACRNWNETGPERTGFNEAQPLYDAPDDLSGHTWTIIKLYVDETKPDATQSRDDWSFIKRNCMHCIDPACVSACTVGALQKDPRGPVTYNIDKCFGCRYCMIACPYHVPRYQWWTTVPLVQKCTLCFGYQTLDGSEHPKNRLLKGMGPARVEACPAGALVWGTRDEMLKEAKTRIAANPGKYYEDRVYGEHEAGGTLQLILSHVPFEKLGLPKLHPEPLPQETHPANVAVPWLFLGVGGLATVIYNVRGRQEKGHPSTPLRSAQDDEKAKEGRA